jgi:hypothetical protein
VTTYLTQKGRFHIRKQVVARLIAHLGLDEANLNALEELKNSAAYLSLALSNNLDCRILEARSEGPDQPESISVLETSAEQPVSQENSEQRVTVPIELVVRNRDDHIR